jgi:hypothetical protein
VGSTGKALACKIWAAALELVMHTEGFCTICDSLPAVHIDEWTWMVDTWEHKSTTMLLHDVKAHNPYECKAGI